MKCNAFKRLLGKSSLSRLPADSSDSHNTPKPLDHVASLPGCLAASSASNLNSIMLQRKNLITYVLDIAELWASLDTDPFAC